MGNEPPERMRVKDIISEPGAQELASSPDMQPYLELAKAVLLVGVQEVQRLMLGGYCVLLSKRGGLAFHWDKPDFSLHGLQKQLGLRIRMLCAVFLVCATGITNRTVGSFCLLQCRVEPQTKWKRL